MNEKTTIYIISELKEEVQVLLIREGNKQSLSNLVNEVLKKWLEEHK